MILPEILDMTALEQLAGASRHFSLGYISAAEFANKLSDSFAGNADLNVKDAKEVAALIPPAALELVMQQIEAVLSPGYLRQAFHIGGRSRTEEEVRAAALRETARERAWAAALKPLLS